MKSKIIKVLKMIGIIFSSLSATTGVIIGIVVGEHDDESIPTVTCEDSSSETSSCLETEQIGDLYDRFTN